MFWVLTTILLLIFAFRLIEVFEAARTDEARRALAMELHLNIATPGARPVAALLPVFNLCDQTTLNTWIQTSEIASKVAARLRLRAYAFIGSVAISASLMQAGALALALIAPKFKKETRSLMRAASIILLIFSEVVLCYWLAV